MSLFARLARWLVRAVPSVAERDVITDYLEADAPDYRGAWRCYRTLRYYRRGGAGVYPGKMNS